jgi:uncharacterized protein YndB with AHSA1/START domain
VTIRKSITVRCPPEQAFRAFTRDINRWWPLDHRFSQGGQHRSEIFLDDYADGRFYQRFENGTELEIGRVVRAEPPHLILFTIKAPSWDAATEVEVRFSGVNEGTRVALEHRGFDASPMIQKREKNFAGGWDFVLAQYIAKANG